jgi:glycosyltransferase involved in cell wall biosynthesis
MKIAQIAPLYESVPPKLYGGTERVVSSLTEQLVQMGHEVTLFASGDSKTSARLVAPCKQALRLLGDECVDKLAYHYIMLDMVRDRAAEFDVLHFHVDYLHFPFTQMCATPHVTTLHGRLNIPELPALYRQFGDVPVVSISHSQRKPLPRVKWVGNVYHGLPAGNFKLGAGQGNYLAFLGRVSREKRVDRAIQIALKAGMPLKIAAKVDPSDRDYYEAEIKPLLNHPNIEYIGEITEREKPQFLGDAYAQVFPIDWPEPFGLCMIEAMACGTPTIAFGHGSVPEVLTDGLTGFIVADMERAVESVAKIAALNRRACRMEFERRFTSERMATDYLRIYEALAGTDAASDVLELEATEGTSVSGAATV